MTKFQKQVYPIRKNKEKTGKKKVSEFSNGVYQVVKRIPKGKVMTYKEVAKAVNRPRACRAIGNVLNKNTDPQMPCHRVIRSDGSIGGYRKGAKKKMELLKKENAI